MVIVKNLRKTIMMLVVVTLVLVGIGDVFGGDVVNDPVQLMPGGNSQYISMVLGDNLMERGEFGDDYVVDKGIGEYYILFVKEPFYYGTMIDGRIWIEAGAFGGYLETDNVWSNSGILDYMGWCDGYIYRDIFLEGDTSDYALGIYDSDGGQFALDYGTHVAFDDDLITWESGMNLFPGSGGIEYESVLNGLMDYQFSPSTGDMELGHTVLTSVPEPATICILGLGGLLLRRKR